MCVWFLGGCSRVPVGARVGAIETTVLGSSAGGDRDSRARIPFPMVLYLFSCLTLR